MKYLNDNCYVEVKDDRYRINPTEYNILGLLEEPKLLRIQYQVQNNTQIRKNKKVIKNNNDELEDGNYPRKKQTYVQQPKLKPPNFLRSKRNYWLEFDKDYFCQNCEIFIIKQKRQIDKRVLRQDHYFSTRLPYANKKIREFRMNKITTVYNTSKKMIDKLPSLKGKTKLNFCQNISNY